MSLFSPAGFTSSRFQVDSVDFDGNDYLTLGAGLSGAADSKVGMFSVWIRIDASAAALQRLLCGSNTVGGGVSNNQFRSSYQGTAGTIVVLSADVGTTTVSCQMTTLGVFNPSATWIHLLSGWDVSIPRRQIYINDVSDVGSSSTNTTLDYTSADWGVGGNCDGTGKFSGCMAEMYFSPNQNLDLSVTANRRKFISSTGKPINLGGDGSAPTGTAPAIYLSVRKGEAASVFGTNRGTGGNFTINGSLDIGSTSPTD